MLPHCLTPITLPAACLPLVLIGATVAQIPCRHEPHESSRQMPDIRLQAIPLRQNYRSVPCILGGVHIRNVRFWSYIFMANVKFMPLIAIDLPGTIVPVPFSPPALIVISEPEMEYFPLPDVAKE